MPHGVIAKYVHLAAVLAWARALRTSARQSAARSLRHVNVRSGVSILGLDAYRSRRRHGTSWAGRGLGGRPWWRVLQGVGLLSSAVLEPRKSMMPPYRLRASGCGDVVARPRDLHDMSLAVVRWACRRFGASMGPGPTASAWFVLGYVAPAGRERAAVAAHAAVRGRLLAGRRLGFVHGLPEVGRPRARACRSGESMWCSRRMCPSVACARLAVAFERRLCVPPRTCPAPAAFAGRVGVCSGAVASAPAAARAILGFAALG